MIKKLLLLFYYVVASKLPSSFFPLGGLFNAIRIYTLRGILVIGKQNKIQPNVYLGRGYNIQIGSYCQINENVRLIDVKIGDYVMIAPNVQLIGGKVHKFERTDIPMSKQGQEFKGEIMIKNDVWIGVNSIIMPGITIGEGSIIAAGSVVTKNVDDFAIMAGNPARLLRKRK